MPASGRSHSCGPPAATCWPTSASSTSTGARFADGRRSLAYALRFQAPDRTLTDAEVGEARTRLIDAVESAHGATLR